MNNLFIDYNIGQIIEKCKNGDLTPEKVVQICIERINRLEPNYKAWVCFSEKELLKQLKYRKETINFSDNLLECIPTGVKDIFNTTDFPTQMGSPLWKNFTPGNDARVVFNIKRAGAIIPAKTVTAEFAVHTLDKTLNPHDVAKTPGTSSSGSAVAVALGMVPVALGTQTAGSIVRPASFCGVYGCKPSFGLIPRTGILKTTDTLDTVGFFVSHACDLKRVFDSMRVYGKNYPISSVALLDTFRQNKLSSRRWKVAFIKTHTWNYSCDYAKEAMSKYINKLSKLDDIELVEVELPNIMNKSHDVHETIYNKTLAYYFKKEFEQADLVSPIMNDLIRMGQSISIEKYLEALNEQSLMQKEMDNFFANYDIIISLSTAGEAPIREEIEKPDPALIWTLAHLPVVSAPVFVSPSGLPFGLQIVARKYNDYLLFNFINYLLSQQMIPNKPNPCLDL